MERKYRSPAANEVAEPTLDELLVEKKAEKEMYASRYGKESQSLVEAVEIFTEPVERPASPNYAPSAPSRGAGVSHVCV